VLAVSHLSKTYQSGHARVQAVKDVSFEVAEGAFYTLLGPSGCGKTTTLRCIAGLERPDGGEIKLAERMLSRRSSFVPPHQRDVGMVFQSYAIWPHMTVFENVAFPLRVGKQRVPERIVRDRVAHALHTVHLDGLQDRPAPQLSGGQQQRLALARALVREPRLLLLDEPLSNLDAKLRAGLRLEIRELQQRLGITTIYVTHDQIEALAMSSIVAVMSEGLIVQEGAPREVYEKPASRYVAEFIGTTNFLPGQVVGSRDGGAFLDVETRAGVITCLPSGGERAGQSVLISIRPEYVEISTGQGGRANVNGNGLRGTVETAAFLGEYLDCIVDVAGSMVHVRAHPSLTLESGQAVQLTLPPERCVAVADEALPASAAVE
jgi:iron(III) transport system ATP-binding protein